MNKKRQQDVNALKFWHPAFISSWSKVFMSMQLYYTFHITKLCQYFKELSDKFGSRKPSAWINKAEFHEFYDILYEEDNTWKPYRIWSFKFISEAYKQWIEKPCLQEKWVSALICLSVEWPFSTIFFLFFWLLDFAFI